MHDSTTSVLIVDDDPGVLRVLTKWLEGAGYRVRCVGDGRQAIAAIEAECPHQLICDWHMPHVDGLELCQWLRQRSLPHYVHTILVTARTNPDDMVQAFDAGADDFLRKPIDRYELLARVKAGSRVLQMERRFRQMATLDPLTKIASQRTFIEEMEREWSRAQRYRLDLSCVMLDLDFFSRINDTFGQGTGDEALRCVANILKECCRNSDLVSRFVEDQFCVLLPETSEWNAALWTDRVRQTIAATKFESNGRPFHLTASFGIAQKFSDSEKPLELVDRAEQALLVAKRSGRDRVVSYTSLGNSGAMTRAAEGAEQLFSGIKAGDCMTTVGTPLKEDDTLGSAVDYFLRMRQSSSPVVDAEGNLAGILSEKDALGVLHWPDWRSTRVSNVMKRNVVSYAEDTSAIAVYDFLCRVSIRGIIIVREGKPVGIINRSSLLRWCLQHAANKSNAAIGDHRFAAEEPIRQQLADTVARLSGEAARLYRSLEQNANHAMPNVVDGAARMQDLMNDMLESAQTIRWLQRQNENNANPNDLHSALCAATMQAYEAQDDAAQCEVWFPPDCEPEIANERQ